MTQAEWLKAKNPRVLFEHVRPQLSDRKARLLLCVGCRRWWSRLTDPVSQDAVEVAERFADGFATEADLAAAAERILGLLVAQPGLENMSRSTPEGAAVWLVWAAVVKHADYGLGRWMAWSVPKSVPAAERRAQCELLREIVGNPFRAPSVASAWLTWQGGTIAQFAKAIYEERRFDDLPILADALEEAGCADAEMLAHCRRQGAHVRGCWAVDTLLGKSWSD